MRAYKCFTKTADGRLMCREMEYVVGKKYVFDREIELCERGFYDKSARKPTTLVVGVCQA